MKLLIGSFYREAEGMERMKKCMNQSDTFVDESLKGIYKAYPGFYEKCGENSRALVHKGKKKGQVSIITGGGYGHLPLFLGYVGEGLCDGAAIGNVFTSPSCETILDVAGNVENESGILFLFGNYFGDSMNFEMAAEMLEMEGIQTATVKMSDDIASAPRENYTKRRGIAGILFAYKIAGAAASRGDSLEEVKRVAEKVVQNTATYGVAFSSCTLPGAGKPVFEIGENDMEIGMGIHGEPGVRRGSMKESREIAKELCPELMKDLELKEGDAVAVLINGLGMTSREELYILYADAADIFENAGLEIKKTLVGEYATSMEMAGLSISVLKLDEELEELLRQPEYTPFMRY